MVLKQLTLDEKLALLQRNGIAHNPQWTMPLTPLTNRGAGYEAPGHFAAYGLVLGPWLYRIHDRIPLPKIGLLLITLVLVICFQLPFFPKVGVSSLDGIYDVTRVLFLVPLIILCGAHLDAGMGMVRLLQALREYWTELRQIRNSRPQHFPRRVLQLVQRGEHGTAREYH